MKLLKLTGTFGCLSQQTLEFSQGLTLIGAPNGAGKSTWCAFLRTMLYGLDTRQRDKKGVPADKNRYRPWNGLPMEGLLVCQHKGETLEIRRTSAGGVPMGSFSATYQDSGLPVPGLTGENVGEALTGVSQEVFDRSVFLRQTNLAVSQSQELEKRITALVSAGEEDVSWTETNERLKGWLHRRRFHRSGLIPQLEEQEAALRQTLSQTTTLRQELAQLQARADGLRQQTRKWESRLSQEQDKMQDLSQKRYAEAAAELDAAELHLQALHQRQEDSRAQGEALAGEMEEELGETQRDMAGRKKLMTGFVTFIVLLTLCAAGLYAIPQFILPRYPGFPLQIPEVPLVFLLPALGVLWALVLLCALVRAFCDHRDKKSLARYRALIEEQTRQEAGVEKEIQEAEHRWEHAHKLFEAVSQQTGALPHLPPEAEACHLSLRHVEQEMAQIKGQLTAIGDPALVDAQLDEVHGKVRKVQQDYDALEIAMEALKEADDQLHARFSPQLSQKAGEYFQALTQNKYTRLSLDRSLQVTVRERGSLADRPLALLSQGTADQLYLALRLAVADLVLPEAEACPLVLDDALLSFDDDRLALALHLLADLARERQIIFFTCQHREMFMLEEDPQVNIITMPGF